MSDAASSSLPAALRAVGSLGYSGGLGVKEFYSSYSAARVLV